MEFGEIPPRLFSERGIRRVRNTYHAPFGGTPFATGRRFNRPVRFLDHHGDDEEIYYHGDDGYDFDEYEDDWRGRPRWAAHDMQHQQDYDPLNGPFHHVGRRHAPAHIRRGYPDNGSYDDNDHDPRRGRTHSLDGRGAFDLRGGVGRGGYRQNYDHGGRNGHRSGFFERRDGYGPKMRRRGGYDNLRAGHQYDSGYGGTGYHEPGGMPHRTRQVHLSRGHPRHGMPHGHVGTHGPRGYPTQGKHHHSHHGDYVAELVDEGPRIYHPHSSGSRHRSVFSGGQHYTPSVDKFLRRRFGR